MDWTKGFKVSYHACLVDPATWTDAEIFDIGEDTSINRTGTGLRESADLDTEGFKYGSDKWIRIWMDVEQAGSSDHIALFTGLTSTDEEEINGMIETPVECYSVLKPAQDVPLPRGWYAAKGFVGSDVIKKLLEVCPAPVEIQGESPRLKDHIIAENNETHLTMVDSVLDAIGWRLFIRGDGTIVAGPKAEEPVHIYGHLQDDSIELPIRIKRDLFNCPNVLWAATDNDSVTVKDEDENSPLSVAARGREVWQTEESVTLASDETLYAYAVRRLKELQETSEELSYDRAYNPDVHVTDRIRIHYTGVGLDGIYEVKSQKIKLDAAGTVSEEVMKI